jgi:hypothetical protein
MKWNRFGGSGHARETERSYGKSQDLGQDLNQAPCAALGSSPWIAKRHSVSFIGGEISANVRDATTTVPDSLLYLGHLTLETNL